MSLLRSLTSRLSALEPLQATLRGLPPGKKMARDKGPRKTGELSTAHATGCGLMKGEEDPPLLPDDQYPDWLWKMMKPRQSANELQKAYEGKGLTIEELKRLYRLKNKQAINEANTMTAKK
ncbi:hypothetical protein FOA52_009058 [Chlamydomonas sp. UWO 241]|nr:hypothetical protein FOA52_009058 [Chlamydomonas sp. UWO 241]